MTPRERIVRLEGLLDRVQRNASRPRRERAAAPNVAPAPSPAPAVAAPAPAVAAPPPAAPSPPAPPVVAAPSPPTPAPPAPSPPAPPVASSAPPWSPEPRSTVQARPSTIPPEELSDDDLIDVTTLPPVAPAEAAPTGTLADGAALSDGAAPADEEEEPPASSSRSKVAESLDQAIASAAAEVDEHEVPIHTPPPESGPQEAVLPAGIEAPRAPAFGDVARPQSLGPTPEQLGETIELEEREGPEIEIEVAGLAPPEPARERPVEELEVSLPRADMPSGTYDVDVSASAGAAAIVDSAPAAASTAHEGPEITARPAGGDAEVTRVVRVSEKAPETFAELLEQSLGL